LRSHDSRVLRFGTYSLGEADHSRWVLDTSLGRGALQYAGGYDLRPWEGSPPGWSGGTDAAGNADDYRRAFTKVETGNASIRFSLNAPKNPLNLDNAGGGETQFGGRTDLQYWSNLTDGAGANTVVALSILVCATDWIVPEDCIWRMLAAADWATLGTAGAPNAGVPAEFAWDYMTVGPEVLSALAQGSVADYDLESLGGGARFVALFVSGYWVGTDPARPMPVNWTVKNTHAHPKQGPTSYAFPIREIQPGAGAVAHEPTNIIAQWGARYHNVHQARTYAAEPTNASGASWALCVANGGPLFNVEIGAYVGTARDGNVVAESAVGAAAGANATVTRVRSAAAACFPYQYWNLSAQGTGGNAAGPAIVLVTMT